MQPLNQNDTHAHASGIDASMENRKESGSCRYVDRDVVIFREGDSGDCAFLIEEGEVEISVWRNGRKVTLAQRGVGEIFGEMAIIDDEPRSATVTTVGPCCLLPITREQLANRLQGSDPVLRMVLNVILERFRSTLQNLRGIDHIERLTGDGDLFDGGSSARSHSAAVREIKLEEELKQAIRYGQFILNYQPIIRLADGALTGLEALIRWQHPERGMVPPIQFIPTAEASGLIVPISQWVLEEACDAHVRLNRALSLARPGVSGPAMSVNFSARDFSFSKFSDVIRRILTKTQVDPTQVRLEITENLLINQPDFAAFTLKKCKEMGLSIVIDDFGTGYSNLSYLNKFPVDTIKIDRSFIHMIETENDNFQIVQSIIDMAHKLGIDVVAEGVELESQVGILKELGCDYAQGFFYSKPMSETNTLEILRGCASAETASHVAAG